MRHLVIKAQTGDPEAFISLMESCRLDMYKVAKSYLHAEEDVADAMQETVLNAYEKLEGLKEAKFFKTWLIRILINNCKDILKQNKELSLYEEMPEIVDQSLSYQNLEFTELLNSISEKYRTILVLYYVEGFNTREIAQLLEMNEHTIKTRLIRARKKFEEEYHKGVVFAGR